MFRARPNSRPIPSTDAAKYPPKPATDPQIMELLDKSSANEPTNVVESEKPGYSLDSQVVAAEEDSNHKQEDPDSFVWDNFTDEDVMWSCAEQVDELLGAQTSEEKKKEESSSEASCAQFHTANGCAISVSKESVERARQLWFDDKN